MKSGSTAEVSTGSISNNTGRAIEVREIRFAASIEDPASNEFLNPAAVLRAMVLVNGKPLMAVPTPIWMLCRLDYANKQIVEEERLATTYVMRLSRPMVLPPGAEVRCQFEHNGVVTPSVTGGICLAGKFTDRREATTAVPYVLFWASQFRGSTEVTSEASTEKNFTNTFKRTLQIDRLICRHVTLGSGTAAAPTSAALFLSDGRGSQVDFGCAAPTLGMARLKVVTSRNQPIIGDNLPIWDVFLTPGTLEMPHTLPSGDFYRATVTTIAAAPAAVAAVLTSLLTFRHQVQLSMVGWREEAL